MSTDLPLIDILLPKYPIDVMMWAKFRSIELLAEMQRVVQREQGTGNREQEKPRAKRYNQDKRNVSAVK